MSHRPIDRVSRVPLPDSRGRALTPQDRPRQPQATTADPLVARCILIGLAAIAALCIVQFA